MADVLIQTLFWSGNPTFALVLNSGGSVDETLAISAAGSHDGLDDTSENVFGTGDFVSLPVSFNATTSHALTNIIFPSNSLSFVRIKTRASFTEIGGIGPGFATWKPRINGVDRGSAVGLTTSFVNYSQDFTVDPADGLRWTNSKVNSQTFGIDLFGVGSDELATLLVQMSEYTVELWGVLAGDPPRAGGGRRDGGVREYVEGFRALTELGRLGVLARRRVQVSPSGVAAAAHLGEATTALKANPPDRRRYEQEASLLLGAMAGRLKRDTRDATIGNTKQRRTGSPRP